MPEFLSPDVFTQEVKGSPNAVPPAATSAFAMAGYSPRGPEGKAYLSTNFAEFVRRFGGFSKKSYNCYNAAAYFNNGGNRLWFVRQLHSDATYASGNFDVAYNVLASGRGIWANDAEVTISGDPNFYDPATAEYSKFSLSTSIIDQISGLLETSEVYDHLVLDDVDDPNYIVEVLKTSEDISLSAVSGGIPAALKPVAFSGVSIGTGDGSQNTFTGSLSGQAPVAEGLLTISVSGVPVGKDDGLGNLVVIGGGSVSGTINYETGAISVYISPAPALSAAVECSGKKKPASSVTVTLAGGLDGSSVVASDVVATSLQVTKQGIYAFDDVEEQMSLGLPDYVGDVTTDLTLITYAENRKDILIILNTAAGLSPQSAVSYRRNTLKSQSSFAAIYYPWVKVADSLNNNRPKLVPNIGHIAGRMAFTDINENVGKAPAGSTRGQLQYIVGIERVLSKPERDTLYPAQINMIRSDASVGTAVWGNKTLQIVGDFTDVNIRRTFINLEKEQYQALLDIVFEDIGPATFTLVQTRLSLYLEDKFNLGVIGSGVPSKEQAFKVICDETNNTEASSLQKRIVIDEFIKPNIAAEFIHLRLQRVFDASQA